MRKKFWNALKLLFGLVLIAFLIYKVGFFDLINLLKSLNLFYFLIAVIFNIILFMIDAINLKIFINVLYENISYLRMFKLYLLSWSIGLLTPAKIGEFSLIYLFKKEGLDLGESAAIVFLNKFISLIALSILAIFGLFIFISYKKVLLIIIAIVLIGALSFFFIIHETGRNLIKKYILKNKSEKFAGFFKTLTKFYKEHFGRIILNFFITFVRWFLSALIFMLLFLSLGFKVNILYIFLITPIGILSSFIPISIGGIGVREFTVVFLYNLIGVSSVAAFGAYIINLFILCAIAIITLFLPFKKLERHF